MFKPFPDGRSITEEKYKKLYGGHTTGMQGRYHEWHGDTLCEDCLSLCYNCQKPRGLHGNGGGQACPVIK